MQPPLRCAKRRSTHAGYARTMMMVIRPTVRRSLQRHSPSLSRRNKMEDRTSPNLRYKHMVAGRINVREHPSAHRATPVTSLHA
jgi:hypothetical protein